MAEKNYAQQRASVLENLDGLRVDVDTEKRIGYLILDREPLNIVSYTGRQQIRAIIEEMDEDDDVGVDPRPVGASGRRVDPHPRLDRDRRRRWRPTTGRCA